MVEIIRRILRDAIDGILMTDEIDLEIKAKGRQDLVTAKDVAMEDFICRALKEAFPDDRFIGEEGAYAGLGMERTWILDPIDGTMNYVKGIPYYGVQIACMEERKPIFCMIILPELNLEFYADLESGAFFNGNRLTQNQTLALEEGIVTFGDFSKSNPSSRGFQLKAMNALMEKCMRIRIQGASSVDFAFVASGKNSCHILFSKNIWELAPGRMLAEASGCVSESIDGRVHGFEGEGLVVAANPGILRQVVKALNSIS